MQGQHNKILWYNLFQFNICHLTDSFYPERHVWQSASFVFICIWSLWELNPRCSHNIDQLWSEYWIKLRSKLFKSWRDNPWCIGCVCGNGCIGGQGQPYAMNAQWTTWKPRPLCCPCTVGGGGHCLTDKRLTVPRTPHSTFAPLGTEDERLGGNKGIWRVHPTRCPPFSFQNQN